MQQKEIDRIMKVLDGNGRVGLIELVTRISAIVEVMEIEIRHMKADLKVLVMFQSKIEEKEKVAGEYNIAAKWVITTAIALIVVLLAIINFLI